MSKRKISQYHSMPIGTGVTKKKKRTGDYQQGRELSKTPKMELKAFDTPLNNMVPTTVAGGGFFAINLNSMTNGSELYQRVGRKVYMKSLHLRGCFLPTASAAEQQVRLVVYYDSQPNGGAPALTDLIQDSNVAAASTIYSEINLINRQRFKILRDYQVMLGQANNIAGAAEIIPDPILNSLNVDFFIKLNGLETIYNAAAGGTITSITSGAIGMVLFGSSTTDGNWEFANQTRLRYYD